MAAPRSPDRPSRWIDVALLFGSLLLASVLAEVALRLMPGVSGVVSRVPPIYEADEDRGWKLRPGVDARWLDPRFEEGGIDVVTDAFGHRVVGGEGERDDSAAVRVLFLGDSFTFGWGVEAPEAVSTLVEDELRSALGVEVDVVNAGVPGYGPLEELATAEDVLARVPVDLVVVLFTENDFANVAAGPASLAVHGGRLVPAGRVETLNDPWVRLNNALAERSALVRTAYRAKERMAGARRRSQEERPFLGYTLEILRRDPPVEVEGAVAATSEALANLRDLAVEGGAAFAVVSLPRSYQVYPEEFEGRLGSSGGLSIDEFDPTMPSRHVEVVCRTLGVPCLSLGPPFEKARDVGVRRNELYIPFDGHWTARGHRLAADAIVPFLLPHLPRSESGPSGPEHPDLP